MFLASTGSSYVALAPNTGQSPATNPGLWTLLAAPAAATFADFYAVMPTDNAATVASGTDVSFPQAGPASGGIVRLGPTTFALPAGTFEVTFQVSVTEAGQVALVLDGTTVLTSVAGRATGSSQIVGTSLVTAGAGSVLAVRNVSAGVITLTPSAGGPQGVSAHLVIKRLLP